MTQQWPPTGWTPGAYPHRRHQHTYYAVGPAAAPSVLLMHEFPGISKHLVGLADCLAQDFRVIVPSIVGRDGAPGIPSTLVQVCVRREVSLLRVGQQSRAVPWLRGLLRDVVARGKPCGVIGMCMTGGFAIALAVDPRVRAAVMAQPAVPLARVGRFRLPGFEQRARDLGLEPADREGLRARIREDPSCLRVRGYRYDGDDTSPEQRMETAAGLLGDGTWTVVPLTPRTPRDHSTLTGPTKSQWAVEDVQAFLLERLAT